MAIARRTGEQCGQRALAGSWLCRYHWGKPVATIGDQEAAPEERSFYAVVPEEGDLRLEEAAALRGVNDEIAVLRMQIRKSAREGDGEATRRGIETLCRALKVQYALEGRSAEGLAGSLARVLDEVGNELGMTIQREE